jgi:hypothetical protein
MLRFLRESEPIILPLGVLIKLDMGAGINFSLAWGLGLISGLTGFHATGLIVHIDPSLGDDVSHWLGRGHSQVLVWSKLLSAAMFGIGWAIAGICPGPGIFLACAGYPNVIFKWWPAFFLGSTIANQLSLFI